MSKKYLLIALAVITAGACASVLAQSSLMKLPAFLGVMTGQMKAAKNPTSEAVITRNNADDSPTSGTFVDTLENAKVSVHQDGDTVVVMSATGDLPGTLTLKIQRDAAGTAIIGGEWAFNVAYTQVTEIENPEPGAPEHFEALIQRGMLKGNVSGGQASVNTDGTLASINSLLLAVDGATLEFEATTSGAGTGQISGLADGANATGGLTLTF